jgi:hypothetical protein
MSVQVAEKYIHNDNPGNVINRIRGISGRQKENTRSNLTVQFNGMRRKLKSREKEKGKGFKNCTHAQGREFYIIVLVYVPLQ